MLGLFKNLHKMFPLQRRTRRSFRSLTWSMPVWSRSRSPTCFPAGSTGRTWLRSQSGSAARKNKHNPTVVTNDFMLGALLFAAAGGRGVQPDHPGGGRAGPALSEHLPSGSAAGPAPPRRSRPAPPGDLPVWAGLRGQWAKTCCVTIRDFKGRFLCNILIEVKVVALSCNLTPSNSDFTDQVVGGFR